MKYEIKTFNPKETSDNLWNNYYQYQETIFREENPKDVLPDRALDKSFMLNFSPTYDIYRWLIFSEDSTVIGKGTLWFQNEKSPDYEGVKNKTYLYISIAKDFRRKGLATHLLKILLAKATSLGKSIIRTEISSDTGVAFCHHLDGKVVANRARNRLYMNEVNWELMDQWRKAAQKQAPNVKIELFDDVPKKDLVEYCTLYTEVMNQAPAEDLAGEMLITPKIREFDEQFYKEKGVIWSTIITRETDVTISGLTEIFHHPNNPHEVEQELTGVRKEYRSRGLGKWLKAEMLFHIKNHFPTVEYVETGNNDRNTAMLSINTRMGFKRHKNETFFEFDINDLRKKLE